MGYFFEGETKKEKELRKENEELKTKLDSLQSKLVGSKSKRLEKLKEMVAEVPDSARGYGSMMVYQHGDYSTVEFRTKKELTDIVRKVENGEMELVFI